MWTGVGQLQGESKTLSFFSLAVPWLCSSWSTSRRSSGSCSWRPSARCGRTGCTPLETAGPRLHGDDGDAHPGATWNFPGPDNRSVVLFVIYPLVILGMVLIVSITPDQAEYVKAVRRALARAPPA